MPRLMENLRSKWKRHGGRKARADGKPAAGSLSLEHTLLCVGETEDPLRRSPSLAPSLPTPHPLKNVHRCGGSALQSRSSWAARKSHFHASHAINKDAAEKHSIGRDYAHTCCVWDIHPVACLSTNLVDPASCHMLDSRTKPCKCKSTCVYTGGLCTAH